MVQASQKDSHAIWSQRCKTQKEIGFRDMSAHSPGQSVPNRSCTDKIRFNEAVATFDQYTSFKIPTAAAIFAFATVTYMEKLPNCILF